MEFWTTLWHSKRDLLAWDLYASVIGGATVGYFVPLSLADVPKAAMINGIASAELSVGTGLLGVVLAGLSILSAFLNPEYLKAFAKADAGLGGNLFPFWFTAALAVLTCVAGMSTLVFGHVMPERSLRCLLGVGSWLFLYTIFATLNLVGETIHHGIHRAAQILRDRNPQWQARDAWKPPEPGERPDVGECDRDSKGR